MRQHIILAGLLAALVGAVAAIAQPPAVVVPPADPTAPPAPATTPPSEKLPTASTDAPLARFEPLLAQPHQTQAAVRAVILGASWMTRMNQAQGRFMYGVAAAGRATTTWASPALSRCSRCSSAARNGERRQSILALLAATKIDPGPQLPDPLPSSPTCNRVRFARSPGDLRFRTRSEARRGSGCAFLESNASPTGPCHTEGTTIPNIDPRGCTNTGWHHVLVGNRFAAWKLEVANKGLATYRAKFKSSPHPLLAATLSLSEELHRQTSRMTRPLPYLR